MNTSLNYVDTHCHIDSILHKTKIETYQELKAEFFPETFAKAIHISCSTNSIEFAKKLIESHEEVYAGIGIHPHDAIEYTDELHLEIAALMGHQKVLAWGEIGLDYHYDYSPRDVQKQVFERQLQQGLALEMPIIIHTREADEDTLEILTRNVTESSKVHIHCFTGSPEFAKQLLKLPGRIFFGFTGVITFKNAEEIRDSVRAVPLSKILLETDSPYMAPVPHRGQVAHPGHIPLIAEKIAEIKFKTFDKVLETCRENTQRLYGI